MFSGALIGALVSVGVDPPRNKKDLARKVFVCLFTSVLLTPFVTPLARQLPIFRSLGQMESDMMVASIAGVLAIIGWYLARILVNTTKNRKNKDVLDVYKEIKKEIDK